MNAFITYHLESSLIIAVFYLFYRLLLRNETFFRTNRFLLLSSIPIAYIIPLIDIPIQSATPVAGIPVVTLPAINLAPATTVQAEAATSTSPLLYLYILGATLLVGHALYGFFSIYRLRRKAQANRNKRQETYYIHKGDSFSFFRMVFLNTENKSEIELKQIEAHERVHVEEYHSVDALLVHLAIIFQWFNPFVWLMKYAIFENHEFIADRETSRNASEYSYQDLLLRQAAGIPLSSLVHPFNKISLKRRFKMLLRNQSNKINLFKYSLLIPIIGSLFWGISCDNKGDTLFNDGEEDWGEKVVNSLTDDSASKEAIAFMSDGNDGPTYIMNVKNKEANTMPDKGPEFKGAESLQEYLNKNIEYPEEAKVNNISGIVFVYFEINKKGAVQNARIIRGIRGSFDEEVLNAVKSMPDWEPAYFLGQPLVIQMVMPVNFSKMPHNSMRINSGKRPGFPKTIQEKRNHL